MVFLRFCGFFRQHCADGLYRTGEASRRTRFYTIG
jgi:hypothetical protein